MSVYSTFLSGGASFVCGIGDLAGIQLPKQGDFSFGFTLPPDYTPGTPVALKVVWHINTTGCN